MFGDFTLLGAIRIGGPVMYLLIIYSILSATIIFERFFHYQKISKALRAPFMRSIKNEIEKGDIKKAVTICDQTQSPFSAVAAAGLNASHLDEKEISEAMERETIIEADKLEKFTAIVGTIGSTAVYVGLLGTVWGIMQAFQDITHLQSGGINVVIRGVSEALVCTAAGLFVSIPAVMANNYFIKRINRFVMDMELCASEISGLLRGQKKVKHK